MIVVRRARMIVGVLGVLGACAKIRVPPEQDDGSTESTGETGEPEPLCDQAAYLECVDAQLDDWSACLAGCLALAQRCIEGDCEAACEPARAAAESTCADLCPDVDRDGGVCREQCDVEHSICLTTDCAEDDCNYDRYVCLGTECECQGPLVEFEYAWAGSCELVLPGPVLDSSVPYTSISIGGQRLYVDPRASCDEPEVQAVWEQESPPDRLTLCEPGCQAFADAGTAVVQVGSPNYA